MPVMLTTGEDMCPHNSICQASSNSSPQAGPSTTSDSDSDSDSGTNLNSAWAGIAVVIVVLVVALGVWYAIRRRRRARGGHNSVDYSGDSKRPRLSLGRGIGALWHGLFGAKQPEQPVAVGREMELEEGEEAKQRRRSSSASKLKRTTTSGTVETDESHAAKLGVSSKQPDEDTGLYPMTAAQHQNSETATSDLPGSAPSRSVSQMPRPPSPSSIRSSLSRLSMPPPGLEPPIHARAQSPPFAIPPPSHLPS